MKDLERRVAKAVRFFWQKRLDQARNQGSATGRKDYGSRTAVTGGAQLDGFIDLVRESVLETGLPRESVLKRKESSVLPGWFRPTKEWDLIVVSKGELIASVEFKSQVGSFGNNYNNRTEEALGNATDLLSAYREGAFRPSARPWLGYFMLLEDDPSSTHPVSVQEPHFPVFPEFRNASYEDRYRILCEKLMRERLYDAACLLLSDKKQGLKGAYREPSAEVGFKTFLTSLLGRAISLVRQNE